MLLPEQKAFDEEVNSWYQAQPFVNETKRIEFLFELYDKYTSGMFAERKGKSKK